MTFNVKTGSIDQDQPATCHKTAALAVVRNNKDLGKVVIVSDGITPEIFFFTRNLLDELSETPKFRICQ